MYRSVVRSWPHPTPPRATPFWCLLPDARCLMLAAWRLMLDAWCLMLDAWCSLLHAWFLKLQACCLTLAAWTLALSIRKWRQPLAGWVWASRTTTTITTTAMKASYGPLGKNTLRGEKASGQATTTTSSNVSNHFRLSFFQISQARIKTKLRRNWFIASGTKLSNLVDPGPGIMVLGGA